MRKHLLMVLLLAAAVMAGLSAQAAGEIQGSSAMPVQAQPKYVFMFIGDGMSHVQINAAQVLKGSNEKGKLSLKPLTFTSFPVLGLQTTYDATSFCPDSASTATSLSSGYKTHSGTLGLGIDKQMLGKTIAEQVKEQKGWKVGIVSTVTLNHATPAAYYAHVPSRNSYYDIGLQMVQSGFDYFGGGAINKADDGGKKSIYTLLEEAGYLVTDDADQIRNLSSASGKVYAQSPRLQDSGSMPYALDMGFEDIGLELFVQKGIEVLDNPNGFFMMVESGKIDWACHANDAAAEIYDLLAFDKSIDVALAFAQKHPEETLIVVTGDHETGGMTIGYAGTGYSTAFDILDAQKLSYIAFDEKFTALQKQNPSLRFEQAMALVEADFGLVAPGKNTANKALVLSALEYSKLEASFKQAMLPSKQRDGSDQAYLLYGGYNPFSVTLTHILNNKAGIGWTSYSHTGTPVGVYAYGSGSELFSGSYDNTEVYAKLKQLTGIV
ncbi:alkaline phosphatase [Sphaerochaeta globosa]|uniref:Alkaline phosphatase n=1 Tax=Sphaerochaeta globosa (strain ATCC BAA-1886 / DSM 22777 / Buddy) TaxID=158189 RepID=F0RT64_SPHGB|nr:alkaline phosphatase [Sphaerochaeta globosa]ADY14456.1 Alkaline phosphatase [Sphaerochaeta globosa str. Buddy]